MYSHVSQGAHEEASKSRNGGSGSDGVATHALLAEQVGLVGFADGVVGSRIADARAASVGDNGCVDGDNVGHGEEGCQAGADLGGEDGAMAFSPLRG